MKIAILKISLFFIDIDKIIDRAIDKFLSLGLGLKFNKKKK